MDRKNAKEGVLLNGAIYAIGTSESRWVKIGSTKHSTPGRLKQLQTGNPLHLCVVASVAVDGDVRRIEHHVHRLLRGTPHRGEWFDTPLDQPRLESLVLQAIAVCQSEDARLAALLCTRQPQAQSSPPSSWDDMSEEMVAARIARFPHRVIALREQRAWTQQELAYRADIPYMTIRRIEQKTQAYTRMDVAVKIAKAFGVSLDLLCGLYEEVSHA
jgi:DNA-binding XRE family transcriptional regulator